MLKLWHGKKTNPGSGVVQLTHLKDGMPPRGTQAGSKGGPWEPHAAQVQVQHVGQGSPSTYPSWGTNRSRAALPKRTWECWWIGGWTWPSNVCSQPRKPAVSWAVSKAAWRAGQGRGFHPSLPLSWDPASSAAFSSGVPNLGRDMDLLEQVQRRPLSWLKEWKTSPMRKDWANWVFSAWERKGFGVTKLWFSSTWRQPTRKMESGFLQEQAVTGQGIL